MSLPAPAPAAPGPVQDPHGSQGRAAVDSVLDHGRCPGVEETWRLMSVLIQYGDTARAAAATLPAAASTATAWDRIRADGLGAGVSGPWMYVCALARALRDLYALLDARHEPVFVGREALPPIAPDSGPAPHG
ncbi:hypothetical protein ACWCQL_30135 [Streptomyces sp. NPDC002073]